MTNRMKISTAAALSAAFLFFIVSAAAAGVLNGLVVDAKGKPVKDAVVYATDLSGKTAKKTTGASAVMDQKDMMFVPHVLPVQAGTSVKFPNSDNIFHHVYSFSPARQFELPLYKGKAVSPVVFDKPGIVALGCNIHDWMLGYIYVIETPYFGVTGADGSAAIKDLPPGDYEVRVWHPDMTNPVESTAKKITISKSEKSEFSIKLKAKIKLRRAPDASGGSSY